MEFNTSRFALTLRKDVSDLRWGVLSLAIGIIAMITIADTVLLMLNADKNMSAISDLLGGFNVFFIIMNATAVASVAFRQLGRKSGATTLLMLPASSAEKFLSRWLLAVPCSLALLIVGAYVGDVISSFISRLVFDVSHNENFGWGRFVAETIDGPVFWSSLLFLQSFFFLGSLLWPRFSWSKSLILLTLLCIIYVGAVSAVIMLLMPVGPMHMSVNVLGRSGVIVCLSVMTVINYVISYFRFREADIINRL